MIQKSGQNSSFGQKENRSGSFDRDLDTPQGIRKSSSEVVLPSRFATDFDNVSALGAGGFGSVFKARNKLDGNYYAIKRMILDYNFPGKVEKLLSEVKLLSLLSHVHIVR